MRQPSYARFLAAAARSTALLALLASAGGCTVRTNINEVCGNGTCGEDETCVSCVEDCGACPAFCGSGTCDPPTESCVTCSLDCGSCSPDCGDGACGPTETCGSCPTECGACTVSCGDGICAPPDDCTTCAADCGACPGTCGDMICDTGLGEDCDTCALDCDFCGDGVCSNCETDCTCADDCAEVCGDGCCTGAETGCTCGADCGACGPTCGNFVCEAGETEWTCCNDCPCSDFFYYCPGAGGCVPSCPFIYSDGGGSYVYETEVAGTSLIGSARHANEGRDRAFAPLWARLDHVAVARDAAGAGTLRAKVLEAQDEIAYVDEVHLTVVEHPPGYEVVSSSSIYWHALRREDPRAFHAFRSAALRAPERASWMGREDVSASIATLDDTAVAFDRAADNWYEMDFGPAGDPSRAWLVVDGWKFKEARDLGEDVERRGPRLLVRGKDGVWHEAMKLALPRGDRKAVAWDLSPIDWPEGRIHFRLVTGTDRDGMAIWYVDRARLTEEGTVPVRTYDVAASSADLRFFGAPTFVDRGDGAHPLWNIDDGKGPLHPEERTWGAFTRYGDVRPLLGASDDRFAILRKGDGIEVVFAGLPAVPPGAAHTFFLATDLVYKPRVCAGCSGPTPLSETVEPLPHHGMGHYPPPADSPYPTDELHRLYLEEWNTRVYRPGDLRWGP